MSSSLIRRTKPNMENLNNKPLKKSLSNRLRSYFLTGILVTAPVVITFWIVLTLVNAFDNIVTPLIPERYNPNTYLPRDIPGIGLVVLVSFLVLIGFITANFFGRWIVGKTEIILQNTPFIKFFYKTIKQILETVLSSKSNAFRKAVLLEYPRRGLWVIGFTTGQVKGEMNEKLKSKMINVFVPTTPNPTSGFLLLVPEKDLKYLDLKVDDAIRTVVSAGIISGKSYPQKK